MLVLICDKRLGAGGGQFLEAYLAHIYSAIVLAVGNDTITSGSYEALRRELRESAAFKMIDLLLAGLRPVQASGHALGLVDGVYLKDREAVKMLNDTLQHYCDSTAAKCGVLMLDGRVVCGSSTWWALSARDRALVAAMVQCHPTSDGGAAGAEAAPPHHELPVYLPDASPDTPFRAVTHGLPERGRAHHRLQVCVLCGAAPSVESMQSEILPAVWAIAAPELAECSRMRPMHPPADAILPEGMLGLAVLDPAKSLISTMVCSSSSGLRETAAAAAGTVAASAAAAATAAAPSGSGGGGGGERGLQKKAGSKGELVGASNSDAAFIKAARVSAVETERRAVAIGQYYGMLCDGWSSSPSDPLHATITVFDSYLCTSTEKFYFSKHAAGGSGVGLGLGLGLIGMFHKDVPSYSMRGLLAAAAEDLQIS